MPEYLDTESWSRRHLFRLFKDYDDPSFNVCADVEVGPLLEAREGRDDLIYHSVIPWVSFSSISHARDSRRWTGIPKITFGKYREAGGRTLMPVSVEVHHALMDGLHVGRYFERLEGYFREPAPALSS